MAKRFTDTEKWRDPWFRKLHPNDKTIWGFLTESCDLAGFWKKDYELAEFLIGTDLCEKHLLETFNKDKIRVKDHGTHLQVVDFVSFQYGDLSKDCNAHKPIFKLIKLYKTKGYLKGINTLQEKEIEMEKEIKGGVGGKKKFGESEIVLLTQAEYEKLVKRLGERMAKDYVERLENYIASHGKKYKSHYHTILSWAKNEKEKTPQVASKDYGRDNEDFKKSLDESKRHNAPPPEDFLNYAKKEAV